VIPLLTAAVPSAAPAASGGPDSVALLDVINNYALVFVVAFVVAILSTPLVRRVAIAINVIDKPDQTRKLHAFPVAYMGGVAVFLGLLSAIVVSWLMRDESALGRGVPVAVVVGMFAIAATGLADDIWHWDPRLKVAGQLIAAAALAIEDVGVRVAEGLLQPVFGDATDFLLGMETIGITNGHLYYWVGTAIIAAFVLGGCNAANLIDGLDGLLSGVTAIMALGLLAISLMMAEVIGTGPEAALSLADARIVLCIALFGAVLGFLPHNFNPASIFLGDCGSLLIGFMVVVIILMLGDRGQTHLVFAGLIVFSVPIMDTTLAIIRRKLSGLPMSAPDHHHIHHQMKRALGGVKRAVFALYGIAALFAAVGCTLAWLVMFTSVRVRFIYAIAIVLFSFIGVIAVKAARRQQLQQSIEKALGTESRPKAGAGA